MSCQSCHCEGDSIAYLFDSRDVLRGNVTTDNSVLERSVFVGVGIHLHRLDLSLDSTVLTRSTRLLLVRVLELGALGDGLSEGDSGFTGDTRHTILSLHSLNIDVEMQFTHARDDSLRVLATVVTRSLTAAHLGRLGVDVHTESRVLLLESVHCSREVRCLSSLWSDRQGDDGVGHEHGRL